MELKKLVARLFGEKSKRVEVPQNWMGLFEGQHHNAAKNAQRRIKREVGARQAKRKEKAMHRAIKLWEPEA